MRLENHHQHTAKLLMSHGFSLTIGRSFDWSLPMKPKADIRAFLGGGFICLMLCGVCLVGVLPPANANEPRIVNIYNFVRNSDYRVANSEDVLYETTRQQIQLLKQAGLPATWALQYDALINPRYQKLFKEQLGSNDEIAAWWEIPRPLAEKAGLQWRGRHEWDPTANIGFSPGYTPEERRKLVDIYMSDFKAIFGHYPRTAGSWYIDEITMAYMVKRYGIVASCNCKDQVGTDGYTLWGGYWNQAYYPSRLNAYMPAQTKAGQIDVPVFRMLGSDPIYQYGRSPGMSTLEPVYSKAGGSADWVASVIVTFPSRHPPHLFILMIGSIKTARPSCMTVGFIASMFFGRTALFSSAISTALTKMWSRQPTTRHSRRHLWPMKLCP